jgi:hypothetical protein
MARVHELAAKVVAIIRHYSVPFCFMVNVARFGIRRRDVGGSRLAAKLCDVWMRHHHAVTGEVELALNILLRARSSI